MEDKSLTADKICISDEQSSSSLYSVSFSNRLTECVTVNGRRGRDEVTVRRRSSELTASCTDTSCSVSNCLSLSLSLSLSTCVCVCQLIALTAVRLRVRLAGSQSLCQRIITVCTVFTSAVKHDKMGSEIREQANFGTCYVVA